MSRPQRPAAGLCDSCRHRIAVESPRSVFVRCGLASSDRRLPRYPVLPVLACPGHAPRPESSESQ